MKEKIQETLNVIRSQITIRPSTGVILGSGLGEFSSQLASLVSIDYKDIPYFLPVGVQGHHGKLEFGILDGVQVVVQNGRAHYYEGYTLQDITYPTRVMAALGVKNLIVTNAAGGVNKDFNPGDFMVIRDHINLMGDSPLRGPIPQDGTPRFVDLSQAYDSKYSELIISCGKELGLKMHQGVYVAVHGPNYETPAEIRMFKTLGGDAVGMSTVPEVIVANQLQLTVCGISCITNMASGILNKRLNHMEVIQTAARVKQNFIQLLKKLIPLLP
ncbi:MAG: purine-nucleoside phosphorylase [Deltaproteobacteria bacterium]|nr:purine-nucleoside phosphorylase [Deltaproteobacteria bacterium]